MSETKSRPVIEISAVVVVNGETFTIAPGDTIDFGPAGLIHWSPEPMAEAHRIAQRVHSAEINRVIEFVKSQHQGDESK